MIIPAHWRVAYSSLLSTPVRTTLTILGIIIGVTSITLVLALGEGARETIQRQVAHLNTSTVLVKSGQPREMNFSALSPFTIAPTSNLTDNDYTSIATLPHVAATAPFMLLDGAIAYGTEQHPATIMATNSVALKTLNLSVRSGQFIDPTTARDTVVLGNQLAIQLMGTDRAAGQQVMVKGRVHTVIGVLKASPSPFTIAGVGLDTTAFISMDDGKSFNQGIAQIQLICATLDSSSNTVATVARINKTLTANHHGEHDFTAYSAQDIAKNDSPMYDLVLSMTTALAVVSLIVGGVGIMNIMLVSITERTREIGIRKAIGATNAQIMAQFLSEATAMTLIGGIIGLGLAYAIAYGLSLFLEFQPAFNLGIVTSGLGLALITGITFGIFPAFTASRKDPIAALRHYE